MPGLSDDFTIDFYVGKGAVFHGGSRRSGLPVGAGGNRGKISGWSSASRRRMREFLVSNTFPVGWSCYGVTLTVPGEDVKKVVPQFGECVRQFGQFIKDKVGGGMVWRKELQVRKMPHLHGLVILPERPFYDFQKKRFPFKEYIKWVWFHYINTVLPSLPPPEYYQVVEAEKWGKYSGWYKVQSFDSQVYNWRPEWARHCYKWAWRYCVNIQGEGSKGEWLRYLQDHTTKSKQAQELESGRSWGVVGRSRFLPAVKESLTLSYKQYAQVIRYQGRLATPQVKKDGVIFGHSLGYKCFRGRIGSGRSVTFTRPETLRKMVNKAIMEYPGGVRPIDRVINAIKWAQASKRGKHGKG